MDWMGNGRVCDAEGQRVGVSARASRWPLPTFTERGEHVCARASAFPLPSACPCLPSVSPSFQRVNIAAHVAVSRSFCERCRESLGTNVFCPNAGLQGWESKCGVRAFATEKRRGRSRLPRVLRPTACGNGHSSARHHATRRTRPRVLAPRGARSVVVGEVWPELAPRRIHAVRAAAPVEPQRFAGGLSLIHI